MSTSLCRASGVLKERSLFLLRRQGPASELRIADGYVPYRPIVPRNNVGGSSVVAQEFEPWEGSGPGLFGRHAGKGPSWLAGAARCRCKLIPAPRMPLPRIFPGFHPWVGCLDVMFGSSATAPSSDRTHTQTSMRHKSAGGDADTDAAPPPCGPRRQSGPSQIRSGQTPCTTWNILASTRGEDRRANTRRPWPRCPALAVGAVKHCGTKGGKRVAPRSTWAGTSTLTSSTREPTW
jgi:hypothetical protein